MSDALIELIHGLFTNGISWGGLLAFLVFLSKIQRASHYKKWNAEILQNQQEMMNSMGVGDKWVGHIEKSWNEEAQSLKKFYLSLPKAMCRGNLRRKLNMEKLKSRKLWIAIISAILVVLNQGLNLGIDSDTVMAFAGIVISYILGQSHVDAKKGAVANVLPDFTNSDSIGQ